MALTDMSSLTYPAKWIHKKLGYELGWFVDDPEGTRPTICCEARTQICHESKQL